MRVTRPDNALGTSRLRIQLVFGPTGCTSGGLSIDVSTIASTLCARGHSVSVVTTLEPRVNGSDYVTFSKAVQVHRLATLPFGKAAVRLSLAPGISAITRRDQPDIVHVFSLVPNYLHAAAVTSARKHRLPIVCSPMMHPLRRATWQGRGLVGIVMRGFDASVPRLAARADLVVAATREEEQFFRSLGARRVVIAPPGVEAGAQADGAEVAAFRRGIGLQDGAPVVIALSARDEPRKGLDLLRAVAVALECMLPAARLLLVGIETDAVSGRNVIHMGRLSNADLARAYAAADVAFVPSRYEAFSRVVIEAWQQGRPVVVTDRVGLASDVMGAAGLVIPAGDPRRATQALVQLLTDRALATQFGERGREFVCKQYEWPRIVDTLETAYRQLRQDARSRGRQVRV